MYADLNLIGNDYWHAPEFKVDKFVGDLDAWHFYDPFIPWGSSPDPDADGLTFTFKGNGQVEVSSHFSLCNLIVSRRLLTSQRSAKRDHQRYCI